METKREIAGTSGTSKTDPFTGAEVLMKYVVKPSHFLMQILKVMVDMGFHLNATVPMARGGPLGMGSRRELFVFKGVVPTGQ